MGKQTVLKGRGVAPGRAEGQALVSRQPFMFAHGVEPGTGQVTDIRSDILGQSMKQKVLIFPYGKGSTTGSAWFLETVRQGNGPAAIINQETEPIIATAVTLARKLYNVEIPLVDTLDKDIVSLISGDTVVQVNGGIGEVKLYQR